MFRIFLLFFIIMGILGAVEIDKKAITLGTFYTQEDAHSFAHKFKDDHIYIKISEKNQKMVFVVYSMDIPYERLNEYLARYRQSVPSAYVTSHNTIKRMAKFEESNSSAFYRFPLSKTEDKKIGEKVKNALKEVKQKIEEKIDIVKKTEQQPVKAKGIEKKEIAPVQKTEEKKELKEAQEVSSPVKKEPAAEKAKKIELSSNEIIINKTYLVLLLLINILFLIIIYFISRRKEDEKEPDLHFDAESYSQADIEDLKKAREKVYTDMVRYEKRLKVIKNEINLKTKGKFTHRIYSAKEFYDLSDLVVNIARREDMEVSIIFIHIENFDQVNQEGNLKANDQFLTNFISILDFHTRENDIIARLTNSEFALLLLHTDKKGAEILKEKLLKKANNQIVYVNNEGIKLQVGAKIDIVNTQIKESTYEALERVEQSYFKGEA